MYMELRHIQPFSSLSYRSNSNWPNIRHTSKQFCILYLKKLDGRHQRTHLAPIGRCGTAAVLSNWLRRDRNASVASVKGLLFIKYLHSLESAFTCVEERYANARALLYLSFTGHVAVNWWKTVCAFRTYSLFVLRFYICSGLIWTGSPTNRYLLYLQWAQLHRQINWFEVVEIRGRIGAWREVFFASGVLTVCWKNTVGREGRPSNWVFRREIGIMSDKKSISNPDAEEEKRQRRWEFLLKQTEVFSQYLGTTGRGSNKIGNGTVTPMTSSMPGSSNA